MTPAPKTMTFMAIVRLNSEKLKFKIIGAVFFCVIFRFVLGIHCICCFLGNFLEKTAKSGTYR